MRSKLSALNHLYYKETSLILTFVKDLVIFLHYCVYLGVSSKAGKHTKADYEPFKSDSNTDFHFD